MGRRDTCFGNKKRPIASVSYVPECAGADVDAESASTELSLPVFFTTISIAVVFLLATFFAASFLAFEPPLVSDRLLFAALPFVIPAPPLDPFPAILSGFR